MKRTVTATFAMSLIVMCLLSPLSFLRPEKALGAQLWGGSLMSDTLWVADNSPYDLVADLVIPHGITLMIQAGVTVNGHHHTIQNQGTLCFMAPSYPSTVLINTPISSSGRILLNGTFQSTSVNTYEIVHTTNSNGMMSASEVIPSSLTNPLANTLETWS